METTSASTCLQADAAVPMISVLKPFVGKLSFRQVFEAEESPLLRYAHGLTGQRETAEDIVQEAFLKLHAHWEEVDQPRAWLFRCVRNLALNHLRDHKRESPLDPDADPPSSAAGPADSLEKLETLGTLQLLVSELDEDARTLITLKYNEGLRYDQISERTGLSVGNVGYKLHHLLKGLADSLKRLGIESADHSPFQ